MGFLNFRIFSILLTLFHMNDWELDIDIYLYVLLVDCSLGSVKIHAFMFDKIFLMHFGLMYLQ